LSATASTLFEDLIAAWGSHDVERVVALFTDDCIYEDVTYGVVNHGTAELREFAAGTFAAFPDFHLERSSGFIAGDWAAWEWTMSGTHQGDMPDMPATGKRFAIRGVSILELRDGKIKRNSDYWDLTAMLKQLGFMPESP